MSVVSKTNCKLTIPRESQTPALGKFESLSNRRCTIFNRKTIISMKFREEYYNIMWACAFKNG